MKRNDVKRMQEDQDMLKEYDFSKGVMGKYSEKKQAITNKKTMYHKRAIAKKKPVVDKRANKRKKPII